MAKINEMYLPPSHEHRKYCLKLIDGFWLQIIRTEVKRFLRLETNNTALVSRFF